MTARERIRAAECPKGCGKNLPLGRDGNHYAFIVAMDNLPPVCPCTAPTDEQIIERLAGEKSTDYLDMADAANRIEQLVSEKARIATALSLPPEAGVEEIVERIKKTHELIKTLYRIHGHGGMKAWDEAAAIWWAYDEVLDAARRQG